MEVKTDIIWPFFKYPNGGFTIRNTAKITKINHTTVRKHLLYFVKRGILIKKKNTPYDVFIANIESKIFLNLKMYYNLESIRKSKIIEALEESYNYPPIVLFGSFAKAMDDEKSDIDICVITDIKNKIELQKFEQKIGKNISIHYYTEKSWEIAKRKNPGLVNNIANGITLSGQLKIL